MSCDVPTGPLIPRSGYRSIRSSSRAIATSSSSAAEANRLPSVVACAATLCERPVITSAAWSAAFWPSWTAVATARSRASSRLARICSCSTFSVRSRLVMPLCTCSCPASALNSSIRAFTSCRVTRSRAAIDSRSTWSITLR